MIKRPNTNAQRLKRHKRVRAKIDYDRQTENLEVMKNELELLKKAKNKETLPTKRIV